MPLSLLRGINVAGQKKVPMVELKKLYEDLGLKSVRTYIQSGNVIFEGDAKEEKIEKAIFKHFGFEVKVINRSKEDLERVVKNNPFKGCDEGRIYVTFLAESVEDSVIEKIQPFVAGAEKVVVAGREVYLYCPDGYGRTKLSNNLIEKKCGVAGTTRNWRTVGMLLEI